MSHQWLEATKLLEEQRKKQKEEERAREKAEEEKKRADWLAGPDGQLCQNVASELEDFLKSDDWKAARELLAESREPLDFLDWVNDPMDAYKQYCYIYISANGLRWHMTGGSSYAPGHTETLSPMRFVKSLFQDGYKVQNLVTEIRTRLDRLAQKALASKAPVANSTAS